MRELIYKLISRLGESLKEDSENSIFIAYMPAH